MNQSEPNLKVEDAGNPMEDSDEELQPEKKKHDITLAKSVLYVQENGNSQQMAATTTSAATVKIAQSQIVKTGDLESTVPSNQQKQQQTNPSAQQTINYANINNPLLDAHNPNAGQGPNYFPPVANPMGDNRNPFDGQQPGNQNMNPQSSPFSNYNNQFSTPTPEPYYNQPYQNQQQQLYNQPYQNQQQQQQYQYQPPQYPNNGVNNPLLNSPYQQQYPQQAPVEQFNVQYPGQSNAMNGSTNMYESTSEQGFTISENQKKCLLIGAAVALLFFYILL